MFSLLTLQGRVLREKGTAKADWKERIVKGIRNTGAAIKGHVNKAAYQIQKWWGERKTGTKAGKAEL